MIAAILADEGDLATENQTQESLKTQRKNQTAVADTKKNDLFTKVSTTLDAAVGFMGKTTNEGIDLAFHARAFEVESPKNSP